MTTEEPDPSETDEQLKELIDTDRELTPEEQTRLRTLAAAGWAHINRFFAGKAVLAYTMATPADFADCVFGHMDVDARSLLINADVYTCPTCGRLLKDRRTPVASGILLERARLRRLWQDVENASDRSRDEAMARFTYALGIS